MMVLTASTFKIENIIVSINEGGFRFDFFLEKKGGSFVDSLNVRSLVVRNMISYFSHIFFSFSLFINYNERNPLLSFGIIIFWYMCTCVRQVNDFLVIKTEFCNILKIKPNIYENNFSNYTQYDIWQDLFIYYVLIKLWSDLVIILIRPFKH